MIRIVEVDGDVVELALTTSRGEISVIAGMTREGDALILTKLHIDGPGAGSLGRTELLAMAKDFGRQQGRNG